MVRGQTGIRGMDQVITNLNKEIRQIKGRTTKGLIAAAAYIRRDMDKTEPKLPVDTGNLRDSWEVIPLPPTRGGVAVRCGFSANYARYVHEMVDDNYSVPINWGRAGSGPKFFEKSLERNHYIVLQIIADHAQIR